ncbi:hypothetical protein J6S35_01010 [Candidatus Saccharibacteria bacterium]|nr:hypothetical protein [Candidatus Saccharibacteria bacterium]
MFSRFCKSSRCHICSFLNILYHKAFQDANAPRLGLYPGDQGSTRANDILHQFPFSLPYPGVVRPYVGTVYYQGTYGYFWSADSDSATYAWYLSYDSDYTEPERSSYKIGGMSVRCVAQ